MRRRLGALTGVLALLAAGPARAHELVVDWAVLPGQKVQVYAWYSSPRNPHPARKAQVEAVQPGRDPVVGETDAEGHFVFSYDRTEDIRVKVSQAGHVGTNTVPASALGAAAEEDGKDSGPSAGPPRRTEPLVVSSGERRPLDWVKDMLVGVGFLLALAAFVLSVRNARQISRWGRGR